LLIWRSYAISGIVNMTVWANARNASGGIPPGYPPLDREDAARRGVAQGIGYDVNTRACWPMEASVRVA